LSKTLEGGSGESTQKREVAPFKLDVETVLLTFTPKDPMKTRRR